MAVASRGVFMGDLNLMGQRVFIIYKKSGSNITIAGGSINEWVERRMPQMSLQLEMFSLWICTEMEGRKKSEETTATSYMEKDGIISS